MIDKVGIGTCLDQLFHDLKMALTCRIEQRCLVVGVAVVSLAPVLYEQVHEVNMPIPRNIKKTSLFQWIFMVCVTFTFLYEKFAHNEGLLRILDQAAHEERVLRIWFFVDEVGELLILFETHFYKLLF